MLPDAPRLVGASSLDQHSIDAGILTSPVSLLYRNLTTYDWRLEHNNQQLMAKTQSTKSTKPPGSETPCTWCGLRGRSVQLKLFSCNVRTLNSIRFITTTLDYPNIPLGLLG